MASTIGPAKLALLALLEAVTWPGTPQPEIKYGQPTEGEDAPYGGEMIFLGETRGTTPITRLGSAGPVDEAFNLRYVIDVRHEGDDEQTTEARAWALYDAARVAVMASPTIGGTVNRIANNGFTWTQVNVPEPQAWRTQIVVDVSVVGLAS
jgi:hypothetical protein